MYFRLFGHLLVLAVLFSDCVESATLRANAQRPTRLWLTVNARNKLIEVTWENAPASSGDKIVVQNGPTTYTFDVQGQNSPHQTIFQYNYEKPIQIPSNLNSTNCYDYIATYQDRSGRVLAGTCNRDYPTWMRLLGAHISGKKLRDIFWPGTHDSGAYQTGLQKFEFMETNGLIPFEFHDNVIDDRPSYNYLSNSAVTQDEDIFSQLMHGVRYLDMRIAYFPPSDEFYVVHNPVWFATLKEIIEQVKRFVTLTKEVVIFGLKEFPIGFESKGAHDMLVERLRHGFKDLFVDPKLTWNATLQTIWNSNRYVILAYEEEDYNIVPFYSDILFSKVEHLWANTNDTNKLVAYLRQQDAIVHKYKPVAAMAELTLQSFDDAMRGIRGMADEVNPTVSSLYRNELGKNANVVAVDFLRGTTIVEAAIDWNLRNK